MRSSRETSKEKDLMCKILQGEKRKYSTLYNPLIKIITLPKSFLRWIKHSDFHALLQLYSTIHFLKYQSRENKWLKSLSSFFSRHGNIYLNRRLPTRIPIVIYLKTTMIKLLPISPQRIGIIKILQRLYFLLLSASGFSPPPSIRIFINIYKCSFPFYIIRRTFIFLVYIIP